MDSPTGESNTLVSSGPANDHKRAWNILDYINTDVSYIESEQLTKLSFFYSTLTAVISTMTGVKAMARTCSMIMKSELHF